jgi:hypothetical protein
MFTGIRIAGLDQSLGITLPRGQKVWAGKVHRIENCCPKGIWVIRSTLTVLSLRMLRPGLAIMCRNYRGQL